MKNENHDCTDWAIGIDIANDLPDHYDYSAFAFTCKSCTKTESFRVIDTDLAKMIQTRINAHEPMLAALRAMRNSLTNANVIDAAMTVEEGVSIIDRAIAFDTENVPV